VVEVVDCKDGETVVVGFFVGLCVRTELVGILVGEESSKQTGKFQPLSTNCLFILWAVV
jgi:hypothetical protein